MAAYEKFDDESMKKWYSRYLMPGENVIVAVAGGSCFPHAA